MASKKTKLSGFQYHQRRKQKEEILKKITSPITSFLQPAQASLLDCEQHSNVPESKSSTSALRNEEETVVACHHALPCDSEQAIEPMEEDDFTKLTYTLSAPELPSTDQSIAPISPYLESATALNEELCLEVTSNDPGMWPEKIDDRLRIVLIKAGPVQEKFCKFPKDVYNRNFSVFHYHRVLENGEKISRNWLMYSIANNSAHCFPCRIFNSETMTLGSKMGFSDWQHLSRHLSRH